jgi:hypothetical protein
MFRSSLIAASAVLLCSAAFAQNRLDTSRTYPVTVPVKDAGVFNWSTKKWVPKSQVSRLRAQSLLVYNNTCTWTGGFYYGGLEDCEEVYDEGRIPSSTDPAELLGATDDNAINFFQIGYCTYHPTGTVDIEIAFFDSLGGFCIGFTPPTPPPISGQATAYADLGAAGFLPGSSALGFQACWIVGVSIGNGGFCLQSDGNGTWDNDSDADRFNWMFRQNNPTVGTNQNGHLITGEPSMAANACTYDQPCATDPNLGLPCGHGYDSFDAFWINVDGSIGGSPSLGCPGGVPGSGCYFFGGYPGNPFAGNWLAMGSAGACAGCDGDITTFCTAAGTTGSGGTCIPTISSTGVPSPRNLAPFTITISNLELNKSGFPIYSYDANYPAGPNWGQYFRCAPAPVQRSALQNSGTSGGLCGGTHALDFNDYMATHPSALGAPFNAGDNLIVQGFFRDPPSKKQSGFSNALAFTLCP